MRLDLLAATAITIALTAGPALAHGDHGPRPAPRDFGTPRMPYEDTVEYDYNAAAREAWLADCRHRLSARDSGVGGAVIGGAVGGLAGNRIAGRGNRTVGTIAGAAIGAAAGAAIDRAEDTGRDACEAYLDDYYDRYAQGGYHAPGYTPGYGYASPALAYAYPAAGCCMAQPMMMVPVSAEPRCTETVEYVYEDVPVRGPARRHIPRARKVVPDKRVKIVPEKTLPAS